jgi:PAS domain-containing protein
MTQSGHPGRLLRWLFGAQRYKIPSRNSSSSRALGFVVTLEEFSALARGLDEARDENDLVRLLAALVTASREFIGVADLEGRALFVNEAGRKLVGLPDLENTLFQ